MKRLLPALIAIFLVVSYTTAQSDDPPLFPVQIDGKYGYINSLGEMVIKPQFDRARNFSDGMAIVAIEAKNISTEPGHFAFILGKEGYIDKSGKFVIPAGKFSSLEDFSEGLAGVRIDGPCDNSCYGFINKSGEVVIKPQFRTVGKFSEGTADVRLPDDNWGLIDKNGRMVIPAKYDGGIMPLKDGVAVGIRIVNKKESPFDQSPDDFQSDLYDEKGKLVAQVPYIVFMFEEGLGQIITNTGVGFIDKLGKTVITPNLERALWFSDGLCPFRKDKLWGYMDRTGKIVIEPRFTWAGMFSDGLAKVETGTVSGFIDQTGSLIIAPREWQPSSFKNGLALFTDNEGRGYVDRSGTIVFRFR